MICTQGPEALDGTQHICSSRCNKEATSVMRAALRELE
jgi:hypothetical protein